jgi:hypothetical protein
MAIRALLITFVCLIYAGPGLSQPSAPAPIGIVPDSLFAAGQYPANPDVPFLYSLKKLDVTFEEDDQSIVAVLKYHVRVKVFDASVEEAAVVGVPYYFEDNIEQVSDIRGFTYQDPDTKVPLNADNVRTININSRYNIKEFSMPAVQNGSVIEYAYTVRRRYIEELPDFYLAHQVPTERSEVSVTYPKYLRYKAVTQNFDGGLDHEITAFKGRSDVPKIFTFPQPEPVIKESWSALNVPAVQKENYITSLDDYRAKIKFQLSEFGIPRQTLENSWDFVVAEIRRKQQLNKSINKNSRAYETGQGISREFSDQKAVQDSIFQYLNQTSNYSGSKAPFSSAGDMEVLEGEPSDQAAINQTLVAMLRGGGIDAHPMLISSRESGRINRSFPSFFQFNGQLVHSEIEGQSYFMDASFPYSRPNLIPVEMYNESGLLLKPESYRWLDINPAESSFAISVDIDAALDRRGTLSGSLQAETAGYPARQVRKLLAEKASASQVIQQAVLDGYTNAGVTNSKLERAGAAEGPIELSADFSLDDYAVSFSGGLEYPPMVVGFLTRNPFNDKERDLPVTLDAPERLDLTYTIRIPDGMEVAGQPEDRIIRLPGAMLKETYDLEQNALRYEFHIDISRKQFSADLYPRLLNLYNRWVQLSNSRWRIQR